MSKIKYCDTSLFISPIYYGLCTSEKAFNKELKRLKIPKSQRGDFISNEWSDATVHYFEKDDKEILIVCIDKKKNKEANANPIEIVGLLVHESVHIWQKIKQHIGEDYPSVEFEAYSIQKISQELINAYGDV